MVNRKVRARESNFGFGFGCFFLVHALFGYPSTMLEYYFFILVIKALCVPAVNKVSGYCIKSLTALAKKPPTMQIFPH